MFDISPINTPLSVFATAKNAKKVYAVYLVSKRGKTYDKEFNSKTEAERYIERQERIGQQQIDAGLEVSTGSYYTIEEE